MQEISAGGVVYRHHLGQLEVQLIQDRYGKISLPKGKMEHGETVEQTALREILEETGITGEIIEPLEVIRYQFASSDAGTVNKEVHYYLVKAVGGELRAQVEEIRGAEWCLPKAAWRQQKQLGYDNNDLVLRKALTKLGVDVEEI